MHVLALLRDGWVVPPNVDAPKTVCNIGKINVIERSGDGGLCKAAACRVAEALSAQSDPQCAPLRPLRALFVESCVLCAVSVYCSY